MKILTREINIFIILVILLISPLGITAKQVEISVDTLKIKNDLALYALECIKEKDTLSKDRKKEIKRILKEQKILSAKDSDIFYLWNLLDLSKLEFIEGDYKKVFNCSKNLMPTYPANDTILAHKFHWDTPTWNNFYTRNGSFLGIKGIFSLTSWNKDVDERKFLIGSILQEIPMSLDLAVYESFLDFYEDLGATNQDLTYFILRSIENKRGILNKIHLAKLIKKDSDPIRKKLFIWGLYQYAHLNEDNDFMLDFDLTDEFLEFSIISKTELKGFISGLYGSLGMANKDVICQVLSSIFGENSNEVNWVKAKDPFFLTSDNIDWIERIKAAQEIGDTIELSKNIIKGMNACSSKFNYKEMLSIGKEWSEYIIGSHRYEYYNMMGLANRNLALYDEAIYYFNSALASFEDIGLSDVFMFSTTENDIKTNLAYAYSNRGDYAQAISILESIPVNLSNTYTYKDFLHLDDLGKVYAYKDLNKSNEYFEKAEEIATKNNVFLSSYNKIWHYLSWAGIISDKRQKRSLISKSEDILEKYINGILATDDFTKSSIYFALARYYYSIFDYKRAEEYYKRAIEGYVILYPEDRRKTDLVTWMSLNNIELGKTNNLKEILESQLSLQIELLGNKHYDCYQTRKALLKLAIALKNTDLALKYYDDFKLQENEFAREELYFDNELVDASILSLLGKGKEAYDILDKIELTESDPMVGLQTLELKQGLTDSFPSRILVEENQKINFDAKLLSSKLFTEISSQDRVEWARRLFKLKSGFIRSDGLCNDQALDFSLFTKGLLLRSNKHALSLIGKTKSGQKDLKELNSLRDSISYYTSLGDSLKIEKKVREYNEMEVSLISKYLTPELMLEGLKIDKTDVLKGSSPNDVAIEFIRYNDLDTVKYGAFILSQENAYPQFIAICEENDLKSRSYYDDGKNNFLFYKDNKNKGNNYKMIWCEIESYIKDFENVYFSGDGLLNQLAIEFLPDENDIPINQKYKLHRVFHLADIKSDSNLGNNLITVGVSDHNTPIEEANSKDRGSWSDLPGVEEELKAIKNSLKKNRIHLTQYLNNEATEETIKSFSNSNVSALHFATHGFFKSYTDLLKASNDDKNFDHNIALRSMKTSRSSLSGLILGGGNISWKSPSINNENDNILTSEEVENLNFPNLQLTTLSACETGLGDVDGEGVWGLQRAFRIAGTKSLICSLCKVNDKWTSKFMKIFYEACNKGLSIYDSFQIAQRYLFQNTKKYKWGVKIWPSFILIE